MTGDRFTRDRMTWVSYWMLGYFAYLEAVLGPVMPFLRDDLHLSYGIASLHFSAFAFGGVVTGALGDRVVLWLGRRLVFWGGAAGMALGALLFILSPSAVGTVAAAFLMGVLGSLLLLCIQSSLADRHGAWRAVALTEANVAASIFAILSSLVVGVVAASRLGWRMALILPLAVPLIVAIAGWHTDLGQMRPPEGHGAGPKRIPASFWAIAGVVFLETGVEWCVAYWGAGFLVASGHLSKAAAATALGAFFLAMVIGRFGGSVLMRRIRGSLVLLVSLGLALGAFLLFWLGGSPAWHVAGLFLVGLGVANVYPVSIALATDSVSLHADWASARVGIAAATSILLAPFVLGTLADRTGIERAFAIAIPLLLAALALAAVASGLQGSGVAARQTTTHGTPEARGTRG